MHQQSPSSVKSSRVRSERISFVIITLFNSIPSKALSSFTSLKRNLFFNGFKSKRSPAVVDFPQPGGPAMKKERRSP